MSTTPNEAPTKAERMNTALINFTQCVGEAVPDICSYGWTLGDSYVPFDPDPDEECGDEAPACSQVWVRVMNVTPIAVESWDGECASEMSLELEVGVLRCFEMMEDGEAPTASMVLTAAAQSMDDMSAIHCAAMECDEDTWDSITSNQWNPLGPLGGQYGGVWTFTVVF